MTSKQRKWLYTCLFAAVALCVLLLVFALLYPNADDPQAGETLDTIRFEGEYRLDEAKDWLPFTQETAELSLQPGESLFLRGHFSAEIAAGRTVLIWNPGSRLSINANGATLLSYEAREARAFGAGMAPTGRAWCNCVSPGISQTDDVRICLQNAYDCGAMRVRPFFDGMFAGSERLLLQRMLKTQMLSLVAGLLSLSFGWILLLASIIALCMRVPRIRPVPFLAGLLIAAGLGIAIQNTFASLLFPYPLALDVLKCIAVWSAPLFCTLYLRAFTEKRWARIMLMDAYICLSMLVAAGLLSLLGAVELHILTEAGAATGMLHAAVWLVCLIRSVREKADAAAKPMLIALVPMYLGATVETVLGLTCGYEGHAAFHTGYLFFLIMQSGIMLRWLVQNAERSTQLEHELLQNRVTMMLSQIQPHFLYNALTAIKQLCATDSARAEEAVGNFAGFLRTNLDSLSKTALIPLTRELVHAEQYFKLEEMRFGARVKLVYDLDYTGFSLPTLTVQPLVENAVRYGITKKPAGGTVTVYAGQTETSFVVRVSDDGVGFDQNAVLSADREHIGLNNVSSRIAALCEGTLTVQSTPGCGTVVTIEIPKREADAE